MGISGSVHWSAAKVNEVFKPYPEAGVTRKEPGIGRPFVTTSIDPNEFAPLTNTHSKVKTKVVPVGNTFAGSDRYTRKSLPWDMGTSVTTGASAIAVRLIEASDTLHVAVPSTAAEILPVTLSWFFTFNFSVKSETTDTTGASDNIEVIITDASADLVPVLSDTLTEIVDVVTPPTKSAPTRIVAGSTVYTTSTPHLELGVGSCR